MEPLAHKTDGEPRADVGGGDAAEDQRQRQDAFGDGELLVLAGHARTQSYEREHDHVDNDRAHRV